MLNEDDECATTETPTIIVPRRQVLAKEGETAELVCEAHGVPQPRLAWQRDGILVSKLNIYISDGSLRSTGYHLRSEDGIILSSVCLCVCLSVCLFVCQRNNS